MEKKIGSEEERRTLISALSDLQGDDLSRHDASLRATFLKIDTVRVWANLSARACSLRVIECIYVRIVGSKNILRYVRVRVQKELILYVTYARSEKRKKKRTKPGSIVEEEGRRTRELGREMRARKGFQIQKSLFIARNVREKCGKVKKSRYE